MQGSVHRNSRLSATLTFPKPFTHRKLTMKRSVSSPHKSHSEPHSAGQIDFRNQDNQKLVGILKDTGSKEVAVFAHGFASSKNGFHFPLIAEQLSLKNISSFRFDFSGNGDSQGAFEYANYAKKVNDLRSAIETLRDRYHKKVTAIIGHSKGGNVVLLYAAKYDDVPCVVNIAGRFDMNSGIKERFGADVFERLKKDLQIPTTSRTDSGRVFQWALTKWSLEERLSTDMQAATKAITSSTEVLTIHGTEDKVVPVAQAHMFAKSIEAHTMFLVTGADHNFTNPQLADMMVKKVVSFVWEARS